MTNQGMRSLALGVLLLSSLALMANAEERRLPRQLPDAPPPAREGVDGFTRLRFTDARFPRPDDPRLTTPLPGVAWTPGLPGGGGGNGEPLVAPQPGLDDYVVERLPEGPNPGQSSWVLDISDGRDWASGSVGIFHRCHATTAPAIWERDPSGEWQLHLLPSLDDVAEGSAPAVLADGTAVGWDRTYSIDCEPAPGLIGIRPLLWLPLGPGAWSVVDLPTPGDESGTAWDAAMVNGAGLVIVGSGSQSELQRALLWRQIAGAWVVVDLGSLGGDTFAQGIDAAGVVVGYSGTGDVGLPTREPFVIVPEDTDGDGVADTWSRDDDGDGINDLMRLLSPPGTAGQAEQSGGPDTACGVANGAATHWERVAGDDWSDTALPTDGYPEGTEAWGMNGWDQVVGRGFLRNGSPRDRALLWHRDASGDWVTLHLDDVSGKPQGMTLESAQAINECGDIVAIAYEPNGNSQTVSDVVLRLVTSPCE